MIDPLVASVETLLDRIGLLPRGSTIVVALSGGQDSCALLHVLATLRPTWDWNLYAAHLDHGFRGEESAADAGFSQAFAESLGVSCRLHYMDVPDMAKRLHLSSQEAARRARHRFLESVADEVGADHIAIGHTRDDHLETVLLNILRGTGLDGLRGLLPRSGRRVRPLLDITREQTASYCQRHQISYRQDSSNRSLRYRRNRLRAELLPTLESYYNPEVRAALLRLAEMANEDAAALNAWAEDGLNAVTLHAARERYVLSAGTLLEQPVALQRRILRAAIEAVRGTLENVEFETVERTRAGLAEAIHTGQRFQFSLSPGNIYISGDADRLTIRRQAHAESLPGRYWSLPIPGELTISELQASFRTETIELTTQRTTDRAAQRQYLDADTIVPPMSVRTRRPGDRLQPLGMAGTRKIQDMLTDRKVPVEERDRVPIVWDAEGIVWVVGHALCERVRVRPATRRTLAIECLRLAEES